MGIIQSISVPFEEITINETQSNYEIVSSVLDQILFEFSTLISDVEEGKVDARVLMREIEKCVSSHKGIYQPDDVKQLLFDSIYGYGLIQSLIDDDDVSDIDIPRYDYILFKKCGVVHHSSIKFDSESSFLRFCKSLVIRYGGIINEVDNHCRVSDRVNKLRINVCIPPRNVNGTSLNIRKHSKISLSLDELVALSFLDDQQKALIHQMNVERKNILICGKGAAGKTTLLRAIIDSGDEKERVLICETDSELYPQKRNIIAQYIKKNEYGGKPLTLSDLIREGLTMSLDTYCIGEIVGGEAWDFIKTGFTDHRILGTIHASSALDSLDRLLMLSENETTIEQNKLMQIIAGTIDYVIYLKAFKVIEIIKVTGFDHDSCRYIHEKLSKTGEKYDAL